MIRGLENLAAMRYPGRGIILGREPGGRNPVVVYFITGRSPSSQARKLVWEGETLWTRPTDEATLQKGQVDLLIYPALIMTETGLAVSNGKQTADIAKSLKKGSTPGKAATEGLKAWSFEPDSPIFTPRISGWLGRDGRGGLHIVKRKTDGSEERLVHTLPPFKKGRGFLITTYSGKDRRLVPSFQGGPKKICLSGALTAKAQAEAVYRALEPPRGKKDFRVTVACLVLDLGQNKAKDIHIINRVERMGTDHGQRKSG